MAKEEYTKDKKKEMRGRLLREVKAEWPLLATGISAMLASSLSNQAMPHLIGRMVDDHSVYYPLGVVILGGGVASAIRTICLNLATSSITMRLRHKLATSLLQRKSLEHFHAKCDSQTVLNDDVTKMAGIATTTLANIIRSCSSLLFSALNMLWLDSALFLTAVTVVPITGAGAMLLRKRISQTSEAVRSSSAEASEYVQERLNNVAMVRQCNRSADETQRYLELLQSTMKVSEQHTRYQGGLMGFLFSATASALMLVVWRGGKSVKSGHMSGGDLTSFSTYAFLLGLGTSGLVKGMSDIVSDMASVIRYYELIDKDDDSIVPVKKDSEEGFLVDVKNVESMSVSNVSFTYKSTDTPALSNICLRIRRGEVVAVVGPNGAGKSTLASLLAGLYKPDSGSIHLHTYNHGNAINLETCSRSCRQSIVELIPQKQCLFNMSVFENVRYSNPTASTVDVRYALTEANCNDFVSRLPGGVDFIVGQNGCKLSGGERQRLTLARALLSDPALLVMDEPLASLDNEGAVAVTEAVNSGKGLAMLIITHNSKTLELADRIVVVRDGCIVEEGARSTLLTNTNSELRKIMPSLY